MIHPRALHDSREGRTWEPFSKISFSMSMRYIGLSTVDVLDLQVLVRMSGNLSIYILYYAMQVDDPPGEGIG